MAIYGAYLEDFNLIKIIIPANINLESVYLVNEIKNIELNLKSDSYYSEEHHMYFTFEDSIILNMDYYVHINNNIKYHLSLGKITSTIRFNEEFYYDGPLGPSYSLDNTIFRVWSPVAKEIKIAILNQTYDLKYLEKGLWETTINGDLLNENYHFLVRVNEEFKIALDPYGLSTTPNHEENIVVKPISYDVSFEKCDNPSILELSVHDYSAYNNGGTLYDLYKKAKYLKKYQKFGVNTIQLMPIFGFGGVDETYIKSSYNWGYNPVSLFSISNYLTKGKKPSSGIDELNSVINKLHQMGFFVTMDVVYNHVYDYESFSYNILVPGYFYHTDERGFLTNFSGCGNDFKSNQLMARKFIIDNLLYFVNSFGFDGFRFDLMGLLDIDTMKIAEAKLKKINPNIMLYGEGWNMGSNIPKSLRPNLNNSNKLLSFSFFNDSFRENVKRYCSGMDIDHHILYSCLTGYSKNHEMFSQSSQSINYIECHDGFTFRDYLINNNVHNINDRILLGLGFVMLSKGIKFYQIGQEYGRSKQGIENSYNSGDVVNKYDYKYINKTIYKSITSLYNVLVKEEIFDKNFEYIDKKNLCINADDYLLIFNNKDRNEIIDFNRDYLLLFDGMKKTKKKISKLSVDRIGLYILKKNN